MQYTPDVRDFVSKNKNEISYLVSHLCLKLNVQSINDLIQDTFLKIISQNITVKFNPNYRGYENKYSSISTFLYTMIRNDIISYKKKEAKMKKAVLWSDDEELSDEIREKIISDKASVDYKILSGYNFEKEKTQADVKDFEIFLRSHERFSRSHLLTQSTETKKFPDREYKEFSLPKLWTFIHAGYKYDLIAEIFGVSSKYIKDHIPVIKEAYEVFKKMG